MSLRSNDVAWTDERVETLKRLAADNLSCAQIATELGGITRNAVIGKLHRMKIFKPRAPAAPRPPRQPRTYRPRIKFNPPLPQVDPPEAPAVEAIEATDLPPDTATNPVTLIELQDHHCRWPIGTPGEPDFVFCGGDKHGAEVYCLRHCRIAYQPAAQRRLRPTWRGAPPRAKEVAI